MAEDSFAWDVTGIGNGAAERSGDWTFRVGELDGSGNFKDVVAGVLVLAAA